MSSAAKLTKKQKKALAFRERTKGKGKAKAPAFEENNVPVMENQDLSEMEATFLGVEGPQGGTETRERGSEVVAEGNNKRKRVADEQETEDEGTKKGTGKKKLKGNNGEIVGMGNGAAGAEDEDGKEQSAKKVKQQKQRFILFVGNLKYTTSREAIQKHFSSCDPPPTVRLMTPKPSVNGKTKITAKSKGFAFLEFTEKSGLQQALKMHNSELEGRMINVELTAGGGGKSEARINKLKERNKELYEQRKKRLEKQKDRDEVEIAGLSRPQRYSATSGVEQVPSKKRTWSIPEEGDEEGKKAKKRGSKKKPKALGTGVNAIPVG